MVTEKRSLTAFRRGEIVAWRVKRRGDGVSYELRRRDGAFLGAWRRRSDCLAWGHALEINLDYLGRGVPLVVPPQARGEN